MKKLAITSMYANPIHPGHVECLELSKDMVDELWVIVNNDSQARLKRGVESFQDEKSRAKVVESLKPVDRTFISIDTDSSVCKSLSQLIEEAKQSGEYSEIIFTKGGDRFANEIPESVICRENDVTIVDGLGKKTHSSSDLVNKIANQDDLETLSKKLEDIPEKFKQERYLEIGERPWGVYYVLEDTESYKVKILVVEPHKRLSLQSHDHRQEHWVVVSGAAHVDIRHPDFTDTEQVRVVQSNESCYIPQGHWHRLHNDQDELLVLIEVQTGTYFGEDDIYRYDDDHGRI